MNDMELYLNIGNTVVPYTLSAGKKSKHIKLTMDVNGLKVVKPQKAKLEEVEKVLKAKSNWILKHYINFQNIKDNKYKREWVSGESIPYLGIEYSIIILLQKQKRTKISFNGKEFEIYINENIIENNKNTLIENALRCWYIKAAHELFRERLDYFCKIVGLTYNNMRIKEQKTRWGSCSKKGNLNFNWKLIMSPQWVIDYVIVHEICHLRHMNHSEDYWSMVAMYTPEYKKAKDWLKKNGIGFKWQI